LAKNCVKWAQTIWEGALQWAYKEINQDAIARIVSGLTGLWYCREARELIDMKEEKQPQMVLARVKALFDEMAEFYSSAPTFLFREGQGTQESLEFVNLFEQSEEITLKRFKGFFPTYGAKIRTQKVCSIYYKRKMKI
jgi:hypothetical protein